MSPMLIGDLLAAAAAGGALSATLVSPAIGAITMAAMTIIRTLRCFMRTPSCAGSGLCDPARQLDQRRLSPCDDSVSRLQHSRTDDRTDSTRVTHVLSGPV